MDDGRHSWRLLPRRPPAEEPTATTRPLATSPVPGGVLLTRVDACELLALVLELETLAVETHAGSSPLRRVAGILTAAVSPTDYPDREHLLLDRKVWHDYLDSFRPGEAATKVTERPLSDPEEPRG